MLVSPRTVDVLTDVITGGAGMNNQTPPIGIYRSGPDLERFMRGCDVDFVVSGSRVPSVNDCILRLNRSFDEEDRTRLVSIIEAAADPRWLLREPDKARAVVDLMNQALAYDGLELRNEGARIRLVERGHSNPIITELAGRADCFDFDTVRRDLDRALQSAVTDPEDAVTAACSVIESMCRSVLIELDMPLPSKKDITGLYRAIREPLGLAPDRSDLPTAIAEDVRKVLSGLATTIEGIGALRTHGGDAHGRERGYRRIDARIARLAIHSASTAAWFILETWQHKHPSRELKKAYR